MAEHDAQARKPAQAAASAAPAGRGALSSGRNAAALAGYARLLARRGEADPLTAPVQAAMPGRSGLSDRRPNEASRVVQRVEIEMQEAQPALAVYQRPDHARIRIIRDAEWKLSIRHVNPDPGEPRMTGYVDCRPGESGGAAYLQLHTISVAPPRQGLGRMLMREIAILAGAAGIGEIRIDLPSTEGELAYRAMGAVNTPEYSGRLDRARIIARDYLREQAGEEERKESDLDGPREPSEAEVEDMTTRMAAPAGLVIGPAAIAALAAGPVGAWQRQ